MRRLAYLSGLLLVLALLAAGEAGSRPVAVSFTGIWRDDYTINPSTQYATFPTPWILVQTGSSVCIAYAGSGGGTGSGTVAALTLQGRSTDNYGTSTFTLKLASDGQSATGTWKRDNLSGNLRWTRTGLPSKSSCGPAEAPPAETTPAPQVPVGSAAHPLAKLTVSEVKKRYEPHEATVKNGAIVTICNPQNFEAIPISLSRYNEIPLNRLAMTLAQQRHWDATKGALKPGQCKTVVAHNPTKQPIFFKLYDAIHSQVRMVITIQPSP